LRAPALASHQKAAGLHHTTKLQDNCREQWKGKEKLTPRTDSIDGHFPKSLLIEKTECRAHYYPPKQLYSFNKIHLKLKIFDLSNQILSSEKYLKL
jgi:hypothetical protein